MADDLQMETVFGQAIRPFVDEVARFRIEGFRDYPYLYAGSVEYERRYLEAYAREERAMLIRVVKEDRVVAVATALPLASNADIVADAPALMAKANFQPKSFYYYAEILVNPAFRGIGIAKKVYAERELWATRFGYDNLCLAVVERPDDHPLRPAGFKKLERIWVRDGFRSTDVLFHYSWPTIQADGRVIEQKNPMRFWVRPLARRGGGDV